MDCDNLLLCCQITLSLSIAENDGSNESNDSLELSVAGSLNGYLKPLAQEDLGLAKLPVWACARGGEAGR